MKKTGYYILALLTLGTIIGFFLLDPIPQNPDYHHFSDTNTYFGIPNFWNVLSNLPFLFVGIYGIIKLKLFTKVYIQYFLFFFGIALVGLGSAYYHWNPNNETLVWDRLPMTIGFMSLFSMIISEFIHKKRGMQLLVPLLLFGIASIVYWVINDDLRLYALVQFYPIIAIPVILLLFKSNHNHVSAYWLLLLSYLIAKAFEHFDKQIYEALQVLSGHSLKHFVIAVGIVVLINSYKKRKQENWHL